ncbi:MAG: hypothetical protein HQK53_05595 [Oligoflexia bacterium]|nr:hypothetical protein [Oligoflexia bacterium]
MADLLEFWETKIPDEVISMAKKELGLEVYHELSEAITKTILQIVNN